MEDPQARGQGAVATTLPLYENTKSFLTPLTKQVPGVVSQIQSMVAANATLYTCDQHAGDVLVLPDLWGHLTLNLETSVGVAQEFAWA